MNNDKIKKYYNPVIYNCIPCSRCKYRHKTEWNTHFCKRFWTEGEDGRIYSLEVTLYDGCSFGDVGKNDV